jgi:hypothetical protein
LNRRQIAEVISSSRDVERQSEDRTIWENAVVNMPLYTRDKIRTGQDSAVRIALTTGDVIDLGSNSLVEMYLTDNGDSLISLKTGSLSSIVSSGRTKVVSAPKSGKKDVPKILKQGVVYHEKPVPAPKPVPHAGPPAAAPVPPTETPPEKTLPEKTPPAETPLEQPLEAKLVVPVVPLQLHLAAPENLSPPNNSVVGRADLAVYGGVTFSWKPVTDADFYRFTLMGPGKTMLLIRNLNKTSFFLSDLKLLIGNQYFVWTVEARAKSQKSSEKNPLAQASLTVLVQKPEAPEPKTPTIIAPGRNNS